MGEVLGSAINDFEVREWLLLRFHAFPWWG